MADAILTELVTTQIRDRRPRRTSGNILVEKERHVLVVDRYENLPSVFRKLSVEGYTSCPVRDGRRYVGIISMLDLVRFTTNLFFGVTEEAWVNFWTKSRRFREATVDDVLQYPNEWNRDPCHPIDEDFSRFHVLETMARTGQKSIAIVNQDQRIVNFETQSRLIAFMAQRMHMLGALRKKRVDAMEIDLSWTVTAVTEDSTAINAFKEMISKKIGGVAVVDEDGMLVDSISIRDLRGVGTNAESFFRLFRSVKEFKRAVRANFPKMGPLPSQRAKFTPFTPVYVTENATFEDVLTLMHERLVHRVFVCSEDSVDRGTPTPTHVITQTDILKQVLEYATSM